MNAHWIAVVGTAAVALGLTLCEFSSASAQGFPAADAAIAARVLPDAEMSLDTWNDTATPAMTPGWTSIGDWQKFFTKAGLGFEINTDAATGFYARVYQDASGKNITIAYRSTKSQDELANTDVPAQEGKVAAQYEYAARLAGIVKQTYPNASITLTGHSLGGGLATYAAQRVPGISDVVTFNPARPPILSAVTLGGVKQVNVVVPGDLVGNPKAGGDPYFGFGSLPGKTYQVQSITDKGQNLLNRGAWQPGSYDSHSLLGITGGLCDVSSSSSCRQILTVAAAANPVQSAKLPTSPWSPATSSAPAQQVRQAPSQQAVASAPAQQVHQAPARQVVASTPKYQPSTTNYGARYMPTSASPTFPVVTAAVYRPGGISLTKAAAERMSLNINLEGLHYSNGQIVLAGRPDSEGGIDAALFLTTLRMACESSDPTFSLDPDHPEAWTEQGLAVARAIWEQTKPDYNFNSNVPGNRGHNATIPDGLTLQTLSVRRDFSKQWAKLAPSYPDLKARLVFRPDWMRQTRVGEILYKADVLLKELASGMSLVNPNVKLRAAAVNGYLAANLRSTIEAPLNPTATPGVRNSRLWFDLIPQNAANADPSPAILPVLDRSRNPQLYSVLDRRGLLSSRAPAALKKSALFTVGENTDLSGVYPKMFVRRHDPITNRDIPGADAYLNALAADINDRTQQYAAAYKELRDLTEVFRAYVANVAIVRQDRTACQTVHQIPIYDAEKVSAPLPEFHPSEIFLYVMRYVAHEGRRRLLWLNSGNSVSGGIALRAQQFYDESSVAMETQVIANMNRELAKAAPVVDKASWRSDSGLNFILINLREEAGDAQADLTRLSPASGAPVKRTANRAFTGESYKSFAGGRSDQCEQFCLKEQMCVAFAFDKSVNRCDLFDTLGEVRPSASSDIGVKDAGTIH